MRLQTCIVRKVVGLVLKGKSQKPKYGISQHYKIIFKNA